MNEDLEKYKKYPNDIITGKIRANRYIKLACDRFLSWFNRDDLEFRSEKVDEVINFIEKLEQYQGKWAGQKLLLEEWQKFFIAGIYGWYYKGTTKRVTRHVRLEIPRKNGKSTLIAALGLYHLVKGDEGGTEVDIVALTRQQAQILYDMCYNISKRMDRSGKHIFRNRNRVKYPKKDSFIQVLASESAALDGFSSSVTILDEAHNQPNDKLYNVLASSQMARENPLTIMITSAGFLLSGFYYKDIRPGLIAILEGRVEDDSTFSLIYCLDKEEDIFDKSCWKSVNPNLGVSVFEDALQDRVNSIKINPVNMVDVKTKNFGIWCSSSEVWLDNDLIINNSKPINLEMFKGVKDIYCCVGIDLASVSDFTAVSICWPYQEKFYFKTWYFLPQDTVLDSPNSELYKKCKELGFLEVTPGNCTDYEYILNKLLEVNKKLKIFKIGYDTYNATQFTINATQQRLPMYPFSQTLGNFNRPCREFERLLKSGKLVIDYNPLTNFCFQNAVLKTDWNNNAKPVKGGNQSQKIDGVISMLEALGIMLDSKPFKHFFEAL